MLVQIECTQSIDEPPSSITSQFLFMLHSFRHFASNGSSINRNRTFTRCNNVPYKTLNVRFFLSLPHSTLPSSHRDPRVLFLHWILNIIYCEHVLRSSHLNSLLFSEQKHKWTRPIIGQNMRIAINNRSSINGYWASGILHVECIITKFFLTKINCINIQLVFSLFTDSNSTCLRILNY